MSKFSERFGFVKPQIELRLQDMPPSLREGLWDVVSMSFFSTTDNFNIIGSHEGIDRTFDQLTDTIWFQFFRESIDRKAMRGFEIRSQIKDRFFKREFHYVYDFLEFMAKIDFRQYSGVTGGAAFCLLCNQVLEREKAAVRFANEVLIKVTNQAELDEIEAAMSVKSAASVSAHIRRAAELFSQRPSPDYRNSIKESISAIESAANLVAGNRTSGISKSLRGVLDDLDIHPALVQGFEKIYAYTSDEGGIRHALSEKEKITHEDAKFMLVACSAFANYLMVKCEL